MISRRLVLFLLFITVVSPLVLFTERLGTFTTSSANEGFGEEISTVSFGSETDKLNAVQQESPNKVKEPIGIVYLENSGESLLKSKENLVENDSSLGNTGEHKSRVLSAADDDVQSGGNTSEGGDHIEQVTTKSNENAHIEQVTDQVEREKDENGEESDEAAEINEESKALEEKKVNEDVTSGDKEENKEEVATVHVLPTVQKVEQTAETTPVEMEEKRKEGPRGRGSRKVIDERQSNPPPMPDFRVRQMRDQLIRARVYQSLGPIRNNPHFIRELRLRVREVQRALGDATRDSQLPRNANDKTKAMEQTLAKAKQIQDDCSTVVKKLRAILQSTEEQLRAHKKQAMFLTQLAAKTLPKGLHCLPLRLSTEYYSLNSSQREFPNQEKLEDAKLYHYALFSDNILAASVVVNSTITHAKEPEKHVFHVVTDKLNYAAMRMWFLANPPGKATIQVQSVDEFTWLNASYSPVLKQLGSSSMIDYYFRTHRANSDSNLKFRNPKYLSILNHLRFYLPEIFPKLQKVLFLDDDIVVRKDLSALWAIDMKGMINGAVETCQESFHRFDRYLNFSNPLIAKNFNPRACGWAYGMNMFDLEEWKKQKITEVYHSWQKLNHDRQLWKLGTLPPGLITFWKRTFPLDKSWHVLGLGYNPNVDQKEIEHAAVIHYNGNMKPWLEIGMPRYRHYWSKHVDYDQVYLRECNINP
ncbi:probable galacturonosyltransferase 4 isoform X2 [Nymphaea colorata]|uniref:probable galacturonosyltransferase 4 isoform X2 n=1 Tax=Nymphaea colorata TaxID=210225 RepID=UPI00129D64B5|nr:probable galacturonosyltransferase 4 isoform X2 [Nymphaea colorata]